MADERLKQAEALWERIGGPGNSQAVWNILKMLIDYLKDQEPPKVAVDEEGNGKH